MLPLPVLDHAEHLEGGDDVVGVDAHLLAEELDRELLVGAAVADVLQDDVLPVRPGWRISSLIIINTHPVITLDDVFMITMHEARQASMLGGSPDMRSYTKPGLFNSRIEWAVHTGDAVLQCRIYL